MRHDACTHLALASRRVHDGPPSDRLVPGLACPERARASRGAQRSADHVDAARAIVPGRSQLADDSQQLGARRSVVNRCRPARSHLGAAPAASIPADRRANAAPPVLEFDAAGKLLSSWGGPGDGYDWPDREHGIYADEKGFIWIGGNGGWPKPAAEGRTDDMILKFTSAGKFVRQIGARGKSTGNADTVNVHQPADMFVHSPTNELFVADGYGNQRVVVFDAESGRFKRVGRVRQRADAGDDGQSAAVRAAGTEPPMQFGLVHAVKVSRDNIVYVADRTYRRLQTFTLEGKFLRQVMLPSDTDVAPVPAGFAFSPDPKQQYLYVVDSGPMRVVIFDRATMTAIGSLGMRGPKPGDFDIVHHMAADSKGNLYTAEIVTNRRAQRFVLR